MNYLSLFSGIEAASVAWEPLGWRPLAFAEIEPFPAAVLAHRFPEVPNLSDVTEFKRWPNACLCDTGNASRPKRGSRTDGFGSQESGSYVHFERDRPAFGRNNCKQCGGFYGTVNLIVGGSPCQSFSVAGLRKGMDDPRGNLALTYLAIVAKYQPEWVVWENVPGVLSSNGGRDFGSFLGALGSLGYGFAWRVLDAQSVRSRRFPRAVPQRRRRLFVVGNLRDVRRSGAVLFDSDSLRGDIETGRGKRKDTSGNVSGRAQTESDRNNLGVIYENNRRDTVREYAGVANTLQSFMGTGGNNIPFLAADVVRKLTPVECERLQGFPDDWTRIPYRGKDADQCPDGPRYKAIGNSMAVNVMEWIGERIDFIHKLEVGDYA